MMEHINLADIKPALNSCYVNPIWLLYIIYFICLLIFFQDFYVYIN